MNDADLTSPVLPFLYLTTKVLKALRLEAKDLTKAITAKNELVVKVDTLALRIRNQVLSPLVYLSNTRVAGSRALGGHSSF